MKKMIKLSLVAAVAVAGLTTTSSAKALAESIKGVDFSGSMTYRYDDRSSDYAGGINTNDNHDNRYKLVLKVKSPINDTVTANVVAVTGGTLNTADANPAFVLPVASFTAKLGSATVTAGKQGIATPWTTAGHYIDGVQTGSGVVVTVPVGPVTLAAAHFLNNNITKLAIKDNNITVLAALGKFGVVDAQLWYANVAGTENFVGAKAVTLTVGANIGPVRVDFRHADLKAKGGEKQKVDAIKASMKIGAVKIGATYAKGGSNGDLVSLDSGANNANSVFTGWSNHLGQGGKYNADTFGIYASMPVGPVSIKLNYSQLEYEANATNSDATTEVQDIFTQVSYKMSSNFSGYIRLGKVVTDVENDEARDQTRGRLQVKYTF